MSPDKSIDTACTMHRFTAATTAALIVGTAAATTSLWAKSGSAAFQLLPVFAVLLGFWLLCLCGVGVLLRRRERVMLGWIYGVTVISAFFSAVLFFALFIYPLMVCIPIGMLVAAPTFHVVIHQSRTSSEPT